MTDFLSSLVDRSLGTTAAIRPRVAFLFEPAFPHGEPATETSSLREVDTVSGAQERGLPRPAAVRSDESAQDSRPTRRSDGNDDSAPAQGTPTAPRPQVSAAPPQSPSARHVMQAAIVDATDPRPQLLTSDIRQDEDARVLPRDHAPTAGRSAASVRPDPPEVAARSKESGHAGDRGLLVPSQLGARIAADLQSSVSAANVRPRDRGPGPQRAAEGHHASDERNVQVTIGRIEVRATGGEKTPARERPASSVMGLDEYLRRQARRGGQ